MPRRAAASEAQQRQQEALHRAIGRLTALQDVVTRTAQTATATEVASILVDAAQQVLGSDSALVYNVVDRRLHLLAGTGYNPKRLGDFANISVDSRPPVGEVIMSGRVFALSNRAEILEWYPALADPSKVLDGTVLTVPMRARDEVVGVLFLAWHGEGMAQEGDIDLAQAVADAGAVALRRALLQDAVAEGTQMLRAIASGLDDIVFAKDAQGRHLFMNDPGAAIITGGENAEHVVGRTDDELFTEGHAAPLREHDAAVMASGEPATFDETVDLPGIGVRRFTVRKAPLRSPTGEITGVVGIARDITERAALEHALREAEQRLRALQNSPVLGVVAGESNRLLEANDAFLHMLGIERADLERGLTWDDFALPEWAAADQHAFEVAVATGSPPVYEKEYLRPDGTRLPVLVASVLLDSAATSWIAVVTDLSSQRAAEAEVRRSEERYRSLAEATTSIVWIVDSEARVRERQPTWEAFTGQQWPDHAGTRWARMIHPDDRERIREEWTEAARKRCVYETSGRLWHAPTGEYRHMQARAVPIIDGDVVREWVGTLTDVHERTLTRLDAIADAQLRAAVLDTLEDGLLVATRDGTIVESNPAFERLTGFPRAALINASPPLPWVPASPDGAERHRELWRRAVREGGANAEVEMVRADGSAFPAIVSVAAVKDDDGNAEMVVATVKDITERKAAEDALRTERDYRDAIVAALQEGLYVIALDGRIIDVNDAWCEITGYAREDVIDARPPFAWWPQTDGADPAGEAEATIRTASGALRRVMTNRRPLRDPETGQHVGFVGTFHDITRRAAAEARLRSVAALTARLASANEVEEVGQAALTHLLPEVGAHSGSLLVVDTEARTLRLVAQSGLSETALQHWQRVSLDDDSPAADAVHAAEMLVLRDQATFGERYPQFAENIRRLNVHTSIVFPLMKGIEVVGVLFVAFDSERLLSAEENQMLRSSAPIIAQALDRARLFDLQRSVASALQHAMLAAPPVTRPDVAIAARYVPAVADLEVGGDWFDVAALDDTRVAVAVGDIVGRGVQAAAVMGQLRSALRALATTTDSTTEAVSRLDRFARGIEGARATTLCYAIVDPSARTLQYTPAGHPPALVIDVDGTTRFAESVHGWPLGVSDPGRRRPEAVEHLEPGCTLLFYTDGLVERRGSCIEDGLERLARAASAHVDLPVDQLCDLLIDQLVGDERRDDVALVALRLVLVDAPVFTCRVPAEVTELQRVRHALQHWLSRQEITESLQADVTLAVGEACTNAIEHAYIERERATVLVEARRTLHELIITVRDDGSWRPLARDPRRNRGLRLIADVMDELQVSSVPTGGTRVEMRRKLEPAPT
jgi:PAS domain S-box-containing protein